MLGLGLLVAAAFVVLPAIAPGSLQLAGAANTANLVALGVPAVLPHGDHLTGALGSSREISFGLALRPRDPTGLSRLASAVSTPGTAAFHHYLVPGSFATRFGPSRAAIGSLQRALRARGLLVGNVSSNGLVLPVRATVGRIDVAFRTEVEGVRLRTGQLGWTTSAAPRLPASLAREVSSVVGLDDLVVPDALVARSPLVQRAAPSRSTPVAPERTDGAAVPCAAARSAASGSSGWTDDEIAQAYGLSRLYAKGDLGAGQTIAIYELEALPIGDVATFDRCYFGVSHTSEISVVRIDGFNLTEGGTGEAVLDVEDLSALVPRANLVVYEAPNTTFGAIDEYNAIVGEDRANIVSTSWGECEQALETSAPGAQQLENTLFEEAAAQGQTVIAAAGDTGSDDCAGTAFHTTVPVAPILSVDDPASQPYVLGVGGTSLRSDVQPLGPTGESVWNGGADGGGGGGGRSSTWPVPAWQGSSGVPGVATSGGREVPDVAAAADEQYGITVYDPSAGMSDRSAAGWTTIGGTSSATPIWAATAAIIAASGSTGSSCSALPVTAGGPDLGFLAPELYGVAAADYAQAFHNVTVGNNNVFGLGSGYAAGPGYNLASGLGSPIVTDPSGGPALASELCAEATGSLPEAPPRPVLAELSPNAGPLGGGNPVSIALHSPLPAGASVAVEFGATQATVLSASGSTITVTAPAVPLASGSSSFAGAGPAEVTVVLSSDGQSSSSLPGPTTVYDYVNTVGTASPTAPTVTGVEPDGGPLSGGSTVTIFGSGFAGATPTVSFGGVDAPSVQVVSDYELRATVPPTSPTTLCSGASPASAGRTCAVEVVVTTASGISPVATILPARSGPIVFTSQGVVTPTPGTEVAPASTEYDYSPIPTITSITPDRARPGRASPVTITGSGFDLVTFDWVNFGPPASSASEQVRITDISATRIEIVPPASVRNEQGPLPGGVSVQSIAGRSEVFGFGVLARPTVSRLSVREGSSAGGERLVVTGRNLSATTRVEFVALRGGQAVGGSAKTAPITSRSPAALTVRTPAGLLGPFEVRPCSAAGCATTGDSDDTFVFFSVRPPVLRSVSPRRGPAGGGTVVTLRGEALSGVVRVLFGRIPVTRFLVTGDRTRGDPFVLSVRSPPGPARRTVTIVVVTRAGASKPVAAGTYHFTPGP